MQLLKKDFFYDKILQSENSNFFPTLSY